MQLELIQVEDSREEDCYASCVLPSGLPSSAPHHAYRHQHSLKIDTSTIVRRKSTLQQSPSPNKTPLPFRAPPKTATIGHFRTIYSSRKQGAPSEAALGQSKPKVQRQSESPNRKTLYWQNWLIEGRQSGTLPRSLTAQREPLPQVTAAAYAVVMGEEVRVGHNETVRREIASLTKIMTAYTVISLCHSYGIRLREQYVPVHPQASFMEGTSANLRSDEQFLVIDLLYGLLLPSGNDAGVALAQFFGKFLSFKFAQDGGKQGDFSPRAAERFAEFKEFYDMEYQRDSIRLFVFEMNKHSMALGLKDTHFANPTGLSNSRNYSTARDVGLLTAHCLNNQLMREIFKKKTYVCQAVNPKLSTSREVTWKNTNKHLYQFRECIGAKTGITPAAGPCLSSAYRVLRSEVVVVVLGCSSIEDRYEDARAIYKWSRKNLAFK